MGFGRYRFRRSFGQVKSQFRGARPDTYPLDQSLLDLYPATAAYSLRDLNGKNPSVVRVRRSSDNAEQDFSAVDLNSGSLTSWVGAGNDGFVEIWYDQSGNGSDAVQETYVNQPQIVDAGVFLGEVDFLDGVDTWLETNNSDICNVDELSVFSVLKPHLGASQLVAFSCGSVVAGSTGYGGWRLNLNGYIDSAQWQTQTQGNTSTSSVNKVVDANDTLVSYVADFPDAATFANGQAGTSTSSAVSPVNNSAGIRKFRIGCQYTYTRAGFYPKPIKEIIIYTADQSANREAIEANINNQYDIY